MKQNLVISYDDYIIKFKGLIKSLGLNNSIQREYVLKILFKCDNHLNAEEILNKIKKEYKQNIGIATVYRILYLLEDMKVVNSLLVKGKDSKAYELSLVFHHDHIVCIKCGKIVEFVDEAIERLQEDIAKKNDFILQSHNMMLYGTCEECQRS